MPATTESLKPKRRGRLRLAAGRAYYVTRRALWWGLTPHKLARPRPGLRTGELVFAHETPIYRKLRDVDMELQRGKAVNLRIAAPHLDGLVLLPGETLSYWRAIGRPTAQKGYQNGMVLHSGSFSAGIGGGLCQLSNLLYWMTLHTPLTVVERYRHSFDVFPDSNRTQPFASGATCVWNYRDLILRNDTPEPYRLRVAVGDTMLRGEWRSAHPPLWRYEVYERARRRDLEYWGGYSRHNELWRRKYDATTGELLDDEFVTENHALMMYSPLLAEQV